MQRMASMDSIVRQTVNHRDAGDDYLAALRHVISHLGDGYATFAAGMSRARRRELIRQAFARHRETEAPGRHPVEGSYNSLEWFDRRSPPAA